MNYTGFPVHDSIVSGQALTERVLSKYDLPTPVSCHYYTLGHNDTYIVRAGKSTYYLRVYRYGWRTKKEVQAELDMLIYLHRRRLPVSYPLKKKDGLYLNRISVSEGARYVALFTNAPGNPVGMDGSYSRTYGELVGRVHACLDKAPDDDRRFHH